jgi:hypothetical protein
MPILENTTLVALKAGLEAAEAAKRLVTNKPNDPRLNDEVCKALRVLYFTPTGILSLLKEVHSGRKLTKERLEKALPAFNDREWEVGRALDSLDFTRLKHELGLTLRTARVLDQIRWGKINLRQKIQDEINYYGQPGVQPDKRKLNQLIRSIEQLNEKIEEIDQVVNSRTH